MKFQRFVTKIEGWVRRWSKYYKEPFNVYICETSNKTMTSNIKVYLAKTFIRELFTVTPHSVVN